MKRSREGVEETDSYVSSTEDTESNVEEYPFEEFEFIPNTIERQIIRLSLATIRRANMYDWDLDYSTDQFDYMTLSANGVITDDEDTLISCSVSLSIYYTVETTDCTIRYSFKKNGKEVSDVLTMNWETSNNGAYIISLNKEVTRTSCLIFSITTNLNFNLTVEDTRESSWCYFIDARYHLNRIAA